MSGVVREGSILVFCFSFFVLCLLLSMVPYVDNMFGVEV